MVHKYYWVCVGVIESLLNQPFEFKWRGNEWQYVTKDEFAAILAAVEPKVTILNIAQRLTK